MPYLEIPEVAPTRRTEGEEEGRRAARRTPLSPWPWEGEEEREEQQDERLHFLEKEREGKETILQAWGVFPASIPSHAGC